MEKEKEFYSFILKYKTDHISDQYNKTDFDADNNETDLEVPEFEGYFIDQNIKDFTNAQQLLENIQFKDKYKFDEKIISQLLNLQIDIKNYSKIVVLTCLQLIAYIYFTETKNEESDFKSFIQLMIKCGKAKIDSVWCVHFAFKILMNYSLQNNKSVWLNDNPIYVISFMSNEDLSSDFYPIFIEFSKQVLNTSNNLKIPRNIIMLIDTFLYKNRHILDEVIRTKNFKDIYELNRPFLTKFDKTALRVIALLSNKLNSPPIPKNFAKKVSDFKQELKLIPTLFIAKANQIKMNVNLSTKKIHDIPSSINQYIDIQKQVQNLQKQNKPQTFEPEINQQNINLKISSSSVLFVDEDNFYGKLDMPPSELYVKPFLLFDTLDNELIYLIDIYKEFINLLNFEYVKTIFNETMNAFSLCGSECFGAYAAFLKLFDEIKDIKKQEISVNYLTAFFNEVLFNPDYTVFGPYTIDKTINLFRSTIIDMIYKKAPMMLYDLLKYVQNQPFLFAEIIGRYYYKISVKDLLSDEAFELISQVNNFLRFLKAHSNTRSTILTFIFLYLQSPETSIECLSSQTFIDHFFKIIFEKSLSEMFLLSVLSKSFAYLDIDYNDQIESKESFATLISSTKPISYHSLIPLRDFLLSSAKSYDQIDEIIFTFVANNSRLRPKCVKLFRPFLELMMEKAAASPSLSSMRNVISYLTSLLSFYSDNDSFYLDPYYYRILIQNIEFISYTDILNLICESHNITPNSILLMKRPMFLPLLFIKFSKDPKQIILIIKYLYDLAEISQQNCRALHEGKIDLILLHILVQDPLININGYMFDMSEIINNENIRSKIVIKIIIKLIQIICLSKSNGEVAQYFMKVITAINNDSSSNKELISDSKFQLMDLTLNILGSILLTLSGEPPNRYEIGNISEICTVEGLHPNVLENDFTFFFMLKVDQLFFKYSASVIELFTFCNKNDQKFSICLINGFLCAKYQRYDLQTKVILCPRLTYNTWDCYTVIFKKIKSNNPNSKYEYSINSYRNLERLHDSDFCDIKLESGSFKFKIGGFINKYKGKMIKSADKHCGFISSIRLYKRCLSKEEIHECISHSKKAPNDYFFSTLSECNFPSHEDIKQKRTFGIMIHKNRLTLNFSKDFYDFEMLDDCICHFEHYFVKSLIQDFVTKIPKNLNIESQKIIHHNYLSKIISLLRFILCKSTNQHLSADFASILFNNPESISFPVFKSITQVVESIEDKKTKYCWLEDVVLNFALWEKSRNNFSYILKSISNNLNQYNLFLHSKSYFSYFLICFNKHINEKSIVNDFIELLARLSIMHLTFNDCRLLLSYYANSTNKSTYIQLIFLMIEPILKLKFQASHNLLKVMKEEIKTNPNSDQLMQLIVHTILCLHCLLKNKFHLKVPQIMKILSIDLNKLFVELEKYIPDYPNLFSLTTAIAFNLRLKNVSVIPKLMKLSGDYNLFWFIFPLFYSILPTTEEKTRKSIFDFIASNAVFISAGTGADAVNDVASLTTLISYKIVNYSSDDFAPIYSIISNMVSSLKEIPFQKNNFYSSLIFNLLQNSIMTLFVNLKGKRFHDEILNSEIFPIEGWYKVPQNQKTNISSIDLIPEFFNNISKSLDFSYFIDINFECNSIIKKILYLLKELILLDFKIPGVPEKRSGFTLFSNLQFTLEDLNEVFLYISSKHTPNIYISFITKMDDIFSFLRDKITNDFIDIISNISQLVNYSFTEQIVDNIDYSLMNEFEHKEFNRIAELFNVMIDDKIQIIRDPTLNNRYYSHLIKRKKSSNRNIVRFYEDFSYLQDSKTKEKVSLIFFNRCISAFLEVKDTEIYLTNFSNRPDHFKRIPFSMIMKIIDINKKSVLILTDDLFNKSYLIEFNQNNKSFFDKILRLMQRTYSSANLMPTLNSNIYNFNFEVLPTKIDVDKSFSTKLNRYFMPYYRISAFDYLNIANLMAGKTYLSSPSNYPIFPSPEMLKYDSSADVDEETQKKITGYANPEDYFFFGSETNENLMTIYENRKLLESKSSMIIVKKFVELNFENSFQKNEQNYNENIPLSQEQQAETELDSLESSSSNVFDPNSIQTVSKLFTAQELKIKISQNHSKFNTKPKIIFASALKISKKPPNTFCLVYNTGVISFITVTFDRGGNAKCDEIGHHKKIHELTSSKSFRFSSINEGLIAFHNDEPLLKTITQEGIIDKRNVFFEQHLFSNNIFMRTPSIVSQSVGHFYDHSFIQPPLNLYFSSPLQSSTSTTKKSYLDNVRDICFVSHKVICMAMNEDMKIFALGCDDCKVRIRNLSTGKKIKTISLLTDDKEDDGIPRKMLITNRWGFVIVNTLHKLFVFSVNGVLIQCIDDFPKIVRWFTFYNSEGFDYVGFESQDKPYNIFYFEALKPSERKFKMVPSSRSPSKIMLIHYDVNWNSFLVLSNDGRIHILPFN